MSAGRIAATFARDEWSEERILSAALSGYRQPAEPRDGEPSGAVRV
jgi:hypothetical protein